MDVQNPLQPDPSLGGATPLQALQALNQSVAEALVSCLKGQPQQATQHLLLALPQLMAALGALRQKSSLRVSGPEALEGASRSRKRDGVLARMSCCAR